MTASRRDFLGGAVVGAACLVVPSMFAGCAVRPAAQVPATPAAEPFLDWFALDEAALRRVFAALTARGADSADLYLQRRRENVIRMADGIVSRADATVVRGAGLRVTAGERSGYAFTEDLRMPSLEATARAAAASLAGGAALPLPDRLSAAKEGALYRVGVPWPEVDGERKLALLERVEREARAVDPAIENVSLSWSDIDERVTVATLDGRLVGDRRPMTRLSAQVSARRGSRQESGFANIAARGDIGWYTDARIERLARDAVERALFRFDAAGAPSGDMPVILNAGAGGILLHEAIGHAFEADFVQEGVSPYAGTVGGRVAGPTVTLVDQGTMPGERGALNYDDEGNACRRNVIVQNGVLRSYLHDSTTARRAGVEPTGNGRRESYRFVPMPRMTCTFLENGPHARDEIIASVERGVIADTYTGGQVDLGGGDYTFEVGTGWLVENGRVTSPIRDFRIAGNGPDTLGRITMVADDGCMDGGGWTCGKNGQQVPVSQGMPTVLVSSLSVLGEGGARRRSRG